jgi:hypothetical protein
MNDPNPSKPENTYGEHMIRKRVTVPALNVDKLAAKLSGLRFAPRTRIGVRAGFGSPGSITSGSVMGESGASPGFSIGGGGAK